MTMLYQYSGTGEYLGSSEAQRRPNGQEIIDRLNSTVIAPPQAGEKQVAVWNGASWTVEEDHRQKRDQGGVIIEGSGTAYWLPEDKHTSPARHMTSIGKLPAGAMLARPAQSLAEAQADKLEEISTAYQSVLAYVIAPEGKDNLAAALAVADFTADDPEGLAFIRTKLAARKKELEAQTTAAGTVAAVQAVEVRFAV
jgi:hypothetical protein